MIKNILWDFDGVILDSMKIKGDGFVELFNQYPNEQRDRLYRYHFQNGGVSRFEKIRYFHEVILEKQVTEKEILVLADKFGELVSHKLCEKENLIQDSLKFIKIHYQRFNFHIVSGAEDKELNYLCQVLGLKKYFKSIDGSPTKKTVLVQALLNQMHYKKDETILIGDALSDYKAALGNGIKFYGYNNPDLKEFSYIKTFKDIHFE